MPRLSDETIKEVLDKTDIVDLISEKVALSKQGKSYFGLCPFHHEKTPSFSVEPERKIYNCFSCGEKGNAITFVQKTENISFVDAVEDLAQRAHMDLDFSSYKQENKNQKFYDIMHDAKQFYSLYLQNTKPGKEALEYLEKRGINSNIIQHFELGLAPNDYDVLYKTLTKNGVLDSDLFDLGLVKQSQKESFYDLFRERIMFPIHDEYGNPVAFSGRVYKDDDENAKYINSPQTKIFTKSTVLYNLFKAIPEIKKNNRVVLFEGYMDVIAAHKANIKESVASMGTSLTREQVQKIKKYTQNVTICYDGDPAGLEATSRAIKLFQASNVEVKIVLLPDRLDPDDYIQEKGAKALETFINEQWIDSLEFSYRMSNMNIDFSKMLDIEHFKKTIFDLIKNSSNTIIETYIKKLAQDTNITVDSIRQDFNQYTKRNIRNITTRYQPKIDIVNKYELAERRLLSYFLEDEKYIKRYRKEFGPVFCLQLEVLEISSLMEELHQINRELEEPVNIKEKFLDELNEAQMNFFTTKCDFYHLELLDQEYEDLIDTMNKYQEFLTQQKIEEQIKQAVTIQEKIQLAKYRDIRIKEDKHGQR